MKIQIKHLITSEGIIGEFTKFELLFLQALIAAWAAGTIARDACWPNSAAHFDLIGGLSSFCGFKPMKLIVTYKI